MTAAEREQAVALHYRFGGYVILPLRLACEGAWRLEHDVDEEGGDEGVHLDALFLITTTRKLLFSSTLEQRSLQSHLAIKPCADRLTTHLLPDTAPIILFEMPTNRRGSGHGPPPLLPQRVESGLPFRTVEVDIDVLRGGAVLHGALPLIEVPEEVSDPQDGRELVGAALNIVAVLSELFPLSPSPYLPSLPPRVAADHASLPLARSFMTLVRAGLGSFRTRWWHHYKLAAEAIAMSFPEGAASGTPSRATPG